MSEREIEKGENFYDMFYFLVESNECCVIRENCAVLFFLFLILIIRYQLFKKLMSKIWFNIVLKKIDVKKIYNISGFMNDVKILMLYLVFLVV